MYLLIALNFSVKTFQLFVPSFFRLDFQKELKILSHLNDPNILQVFGRCIQSGIPAIVLEYMIHGDLYQFLKDSLLENSTPANASAKRCVR